MPWEGGVSAVEALGDLVNRGNTLFLSYGDHITIIPNQKSISYGNNFDGPAKCPHAYYIFRAGPIIQSTNARSLVARLSSSPFGE